MATRSGGVLQSQDPLPLRSKTRNGATTTPKLRTASPSNPGHTSNEGQTLTPINAPKPSVSAPFDPAHQTESPLLRNRNLSSTTVPTNTNRHPPIPLVQKTDGYAHRGPTNSVPEHHLMPIDAFSPIIQTS